MLNITKILHYFNSKPERYYVNIDQYPDIKVTTKPHDGFLEIPVPQGILHENVIKDFHVNHEDVKPLNIEYCNILGRRWEPFDGFTCAYEFQFGLIKIVFSPHFTKVGELENNPVHYSDVQDYIEQKVVILHHEQYIQSLMKSYNMKQHNEKVYRYVGEKMESMSLQDFFTTVISPETNHFSY